MSQQQQQQQQQQQTRAGVLAQLHQTLLLSPPPQHEGQLGSGGVDDDGGLLVQLQQAAAALEAINNSRQPGGLAAAGAAAESNLPLPDAQAAVACVDALLQGLLQPPEQLFSGLSGAPSEPATGLELAGEHFYAVAAVKLQLVVQLLPVFQGVLRAPPCSQAEQQRQAAADADESNGGGGRRARNKPRHFVGVVEIEELPADTYHQQPHSTSTSGKQQDELQRRLGALLPRMLQAAALYADDGSAAAQQDGSSSSTHKGGAQQQQEQHAHLLDGFVEDVTRRSLHLCSPWSNAACQQAGRRLVQHMARQAAGDSSGAGGPNNRQQQDPEAALLCAAMPCVLSGLRDAVLAQHRYKQAQEKGGADMVAYSGPSTFQRCLAARQLAWLVQQLRQQASGSRMNEEVLGQLLPLLLATGDDPSPSVQQYGHAGFAWLGAHARPASLQWQGALLRAELLRMVVGCDAACWATAMPAATSLALALEGSDARSPTYHALLQELVTEAERGAQQQQQQRLVLMACVARLAPRMGLHLVRHFAALLPLLLEWSHAYDADSGAAALRLLALLAVCTWPRMRAHAGVLAEHARVVAAGRAGRGSDVARQAAQQLLDVLDSLPTAE